MESKDAPAEASSAEVVVEKRQAEGDSNQDDEEGAASKTKRTKVEDAEVSQRLLDIITV